MANQIKYQVGFDVNKNSLNQLKTSLQDLQKMKISDLMKINESDISKAKNVFNEIRTIANKVENALDNAFNVKLNTVNVERFNQQLKSSKLTIEQVYQTFSKAGAQGQAAFRQLSTSLLNVNVQLKESYVLLDKMAETMSNTIKWNAASAVMNSFTRSVEQAWGFVKSLDSSLNDIRIVTGKSAEEMASFAIQANNAARELGKTTTDYTNAALIYAQQGLSDQEIETRARITLKAANVTGQSTEDVSEELTAVWNGYKVTADEAQLYVDRLAAVAAKTASNLQELSTGMSKVASAAAAMGVGEDQLAAQLSTIISVTKQAPESVGTALRTVYARISDIKAGLDEDGVTLGNYTGKMADLGISVLDMQGNLRDMGQVMEEIGSKWGDMTREQQVYLAQTMAGQRQYNNLLALFDNFDQYNRALLIAQNGLGTLQKQQDVYMESTAAHLKTLRASTEKIYMNLVDTDSINDLIDELSKAADTAAAFVESIGGGGNLLKSLGSIGFMVFSQQIANGIQVTINNLQQAREQAQYFKNAIEEAQKIQGLGNDYTQFLIGNQQRLLQIGNRISVSDFNAVQKNLQDMSQNSSAIDILLEKINLLGDSFNSIGIDFDIMGSKYTSLDDILSSANGVELTTQALKNLEEKYDPVNTKLDEARNSFNEFFRTLQSNDTVKIANAFDNLKDKISQMSDTLRTTKISNEENARTLFEILPKYAQESIIKSQQQLRQLDFSQIGNKQEAFNQISHIFSQMSTVISQEIKKIQDLIKSAQGGELEKLQETLTKLQQMQHELEDRSQRMFQGIDTKILAQNLTAVAGGITSIGFSIQNIRNLGKILEREDLLNSEKLLQIVTNLSFSLPMLGTGLAKINNALGLLTITQGHFTNAVTKSGIVLQGFNSYLTISPYFFAITVVIGLATAFGFLAEKQEQARKNAIQQANAEIDKENKIQEEIEAQKQLYISLEELNKKSKDGEISRGELKSAVEDLIDQYGLEGEAVKSLKDNYEDLTVAIRQLKSENINEKITSIQREIDAAENKIVKEARGKGENWSGQRVFGSDIDRISFNFGTETNDEPKEILEALTKLGFSPYLNGVYTGNYAKIFNPENIEQIIELYHQIENAISDINRQVSVADRENSEYYLGMTSWLNTMTEAVQEYENAQKDLKEARIEQISLSEDINFLEINNAIDYYSRRAELIGQIFRKFKFQISADEADTLADNYIRKNFNTLYKEYSQITDYITNLRRNFKTFDEEVAGKLAQLSSEQLAFIKSFEIGKEISSWQQLKNILEYMETVDLSNLKVILDPNSAIEEATAQYDLYNSLAEQISNSNKQSISKKEYEKLAPEVQEFFSLMANGQYKMTGDAKKFYDTVNGLSLEGFKQNIKDLEGSAERLKNLLSNEVKELVRDNGRESSGFQLDFLTETGYDFNQIVKWKALLGTIPQEVINQTEEQKQQLKEITEEIFNAVLNTKRNITDWQGTLETYYKAVEKAIYSNQLAIARSADSFKTLKEYLNEGIISIQAYSQAAIQLDKVLDLEGLDTEKLEDYSNYLQQVAEKTKELSNDLIENDNAAEIVAKGIMKMNNAINTLADNWKNWLDIFSNSSEISKEYADAMNEAKEAVADLLDISENYISEDFIKQHLDEITEAATGSETAIDELKAALAENIIARIILENGIDEAMQGQILSEIADLQAIIPNLEIGATLEDNDFVTKAQKLIEDCKLTVDQANALFDSLGFEANFATEPQEVEQRVPKTVTKTEVTGFTEGSAQTPAGRTVKWSYPILSQSTYNDGFDIQKGVIDVPAMSTNGKTPVIKTMTKKAGASFSNYSSRNQGGGAPGKSSGSKSSGSSKANEPDTSQKDTKNGIEDTRDIYHDINIELEQIDRRLTRIQKKQDRLYGKELIDNLNKQYEILDQHKQKLQEKAELQQQDLKNQQQILKNLGVTFDEYGNISNYMDVLANKQAQVNAKTKEYNSIVEAYNVSTDREVKKQIAQEAERLNKQVKTYEDEYKNLEKKIKDYDSLRKDMEDLVDEIEEETQKQIEIKIKRFRMEVEIRLEMGEAERDWNKFRREVLEHTDIIKDTDFQKIFGDTIQEIEDITSYFNVHGTKGSLQVLTEQLMDTRQEIEAIDKIGKSTIYGDNKAQAMEDLQNDLKELMSQMEDIQGLIDNIDKAYLNTIDDIEKQFDKQIEDYQYIGELIEHDIDLLSLLYGDRNYDAMDKYYTTLERNNLKQLDSLKKQRDFWKEQWDAAVARGDTQAAKQFEENYKNTIKNLNETVEEAAENIQNKYINAIDKIFNELDKKISNNKGTDYLNVQWELMNKNADEYLDTINSAFAIQETERKYQKALDETKSIKNQQILKELMDEQLGILKNKEKVTQYDVDRAEKLLQVEQARIALQDAQSAKTSMRLKRDSQGNYSYEYVADNGAVGDAQAGLAQAQNDLYNFDKERYRSNLNDMLAAWKDFQSDYKDILKDTSLTEEERIEKLALLREQYGEYINDKTAENLVVRNNLMESAFTDLAMLYRTDVENYNQMSIDEQNVLMGDLVPAWESGIQQMADKVAGEGGFIPACEEAFENVTDATKAYKDELDDMAQVAGFDLMDVRNGVDDLSYSFEILIETNSELINRMYDEMTAIQLLRANAHALVEEYRTVYDAANLAVSSIHNFIQAQQSQAAAAAEIAKNTPPPSASVTTSNRTISRLDSEPLSDPIDFQFDGIGGGDGSADGDFVTTTTTQQTTTTTTSIQKPSNKKMPLREKYSNSAMYYDTGGYTGDWNSREGRIAVLHEKELVLNQKDTQNILNSVNILKSLINATNGEIYNKVGELNKKSIFNAIQTDKENSIEQNVHIEASFPNVNSKREIEEAFNELVNLAAQRAMRR